jgi:hypothetical protein
MQSDRSAPALVARLGVLIALSAILPAVSFAQTAPPAANSAVAAPLLFRVVGPRDEVTIGLTAAEFSALGSAQGVERIARKLVSDGQLTAWQYTVTRAPDGSTRFATTRRIAILRNDTLRIEPYSAALPVAAPPAP